MILTHSEVMLGRCIPGFSSDQIRLDQAKTTSGSRNVNNAARANKVRMVNDAKNAWRREQKVRADQGQQDDDQGPGPGPVPELLVDAGSNEMGKPEGARPAVIGVA